MISESSDIESPGAVKGRKWALRIYCALSLVQMLCGVGSFVCSSFAAHYQTTNDGFPYFAGGYAIAAILLMSSLLAFRVYNKGPYFTVCDQAKKEVLCALNGHRIVSFFMFFVCIFGLSVIWMYGLCVSNVLECSYTLHYTANRNLAIGMFTLGCVGLITAAVGLALVRSFSSAFGYAINDGRRGVLRRVGYHNDVIDALRRQNADMQDQINRQSACMYPGSQMGSDGFTNLGFEPPTPPPYSSVVLGVGLQQFSGQSASQTETELSAIPRDPPKYGELEHSSFPSGQSNFPSVSEQSSFPSEAPPPYAERITDVDQPNPNPK